MARSYRHIEEYEAEILRMREEGKTRKEIGEALGLNKEQVKGYSADTTGGKRSSLPELRFIEKEDRQKVAMG